MGRKGVSAPGTLPRRQFLGDTGAAIVAGTAGVLPSCGPAQTKPRREPLRLGVVGGGFGSEFQFHEHPDCIVAAVADLREDRRARLKSVYGAERAFESYEAMLEQAASELDAVAIFSEPARHVEHVAMAAEHGLHVLSACPAATSIAECIELKETVEKHGVHYMQAETSWYRPQTIFARERFQQGKFGEIHYIEAEYYHDRGDLDALNTNKKTRFWNPDGTASWRRGYPPLGYPTHATAFLVGVTGERVTHVSALGWGSEHAFLRDNQYDNRYWNESSLMRTSAGHILRCNVFWLTAVQGERAAWFGSDATLAMAHPFHGDAWLSRGGAAQPADIPEYWKSDRLPERMRHATGHGNSHGFISAEFVDALMRGRSPEINVYHALAMVAPGLVGHESAVRNGEQIEVPQFDPTPSDQAP